MIPLPEQIRAVQEAPEQPIWTDAEHDEIMRLHIAEGYTISGAKRRVFDDRDREALLAAHATLSGLGGESV